eukprot:CAMPEP_0197719998 /NCGR_PEP_ID=MMETSP1434-20131217/3506_1 /TAXON_ID=265543 /ORGANISM="Minutocellus polymorphus, Strain CCMP3303" /LENGTH=508 /DNA_ID=CAMNT_0043304793 /DNA_START=23 /DNA_END=1549 /DNA_ORIENTATION=-
MGPKQQLESDRILHAFVSRLASCSSSVDGGVKQSSAGRKAGTKRTRTLGSSSGDGPKNSKNDYGVICPGAKQLPCFLESSGSGSKVATFSLPCLDFTERKNKFSSLTSSPSFPSGYNTGDNSKFSADEHVCHQNLNTPPYDNLARPMRFNKLDIAQASPTAHSNFLSTFRTLLNAELRRTALALLQRSLLASRSKAEADGQERGMDEATALAHASAIRSLFPNILEDLSGGSSDSSSSSSSSSSSDEVDQVVEEKPYAILASVTNWVTCPPKESPDDASSSTSPTSKSSLSSSSSSKKTTVTQPIVFEAVLDLSLLDSTDKTTLRLSVPGSITAIFSRFTSRIETVAVHLDSDDLRAVLNTKAREVVHDVVKLAYSRTAIVVGHHHRTPTPTSTRAPISDDSSTSTSESDEEEADNEHDPQEKLGVVSNTISTFEIDEDLDRKMMPPPPNRPPRKISFQVNHYHHQHRKRHHVLIAKFLDDDKGTIHHRPKRARLVGPLHRPRMATSA